MKLKKVVVDISPRHRKMLNRLDFYRDACVIFIVALVFLLVFSYPTPVFYNFVMLFFVLVVFAFVLYAIFVCQFARQLNVLLDEYSALLTKFGTDAQILQLIKFWWKDVIERIKQVYPEIPEVKVSQFISDWIDVSSKIRQHYLESPVMMELQLDLAWRQLMEAHQIPLVFNVHKAENIAGGAFFILSFHRPDANQQAFLEALRQSLRIYATAEPRQET